MERPFRKLISFQRALELIEAHIQPISRVEEMDLEQCLGRICAQDLDSKLDLPPFPRAAMDGYAIRAQESYLASQLSPVKLRCLGQLLAGEIPTIQLQPGCCIKIATGAILPEGADAVVMLEYTQTQGDWVQIHRPVHPWENVSRPGSDLRSGERIVSHGQLLDPIQLGALAASGYAKLKIYAKPRIGIIATGSEIAPPGSKLSPGQVYDCNSYLISGLVASHGGIPVRYGIVPDHHQQLRAALELSSSNDDLIVISGGSSVGARDLLLDLISELGQLIFHGVQIRPGKPSLFGKIADKPILGLPGYPASCAISALCFLLPALSKLSRHPLKIAKLKLAAGERIYFEPGARRFIPVKIREGRVFPCFKESGAITSVLNADGILEIPEDQGLIEPGDQVEVRVLEKYTYPSQ